METITLLATSEEQAAEMKEQAENDGMRVTSRVIWTGPVPPNSYVQLAPGLRMASPEFFFYRKCNTEQHDDAVAIGNELVGYYRTSKTTPDLKEGEVEEYVQRCTIEGIFMYLLPVLQTDEGAAAFNVLADLTPGKERP